MDDMLEAIRTYVANEYIEDGSEVTYDTPLISSGIVDSFSMVSLKRFIEKKYNVSIPDADATPQAFDTVNRICELVRRYVK